MSVERVLERQAQIIAEIRSHLTDAENERASDRLIWQRAVTFGPNSPSGHAEELQVAMKASDKSGDELAKELGVERP